MSLIDRLRAHEGTRLQVYDDFNGKPIQKGSQVIGNPTIGVGTLLSSPGGITAAESDMLLRNRVSIATSAAERLVPGLAKSDPVRFDVVVEMAFQMGFSGLSQFVNTLRAIRDRRWTDAAAGMLASLWATQTPNRAKTLANVMLTGRE